MAAGFPPSPKAKYVFAERELAHWTKKQQEDPTNHPWITDSVLPIVEARAHGNRQSNHALNDLVQLIPTPGHTIDHFSVLLGKSGQDAVITGDMIHSPIQARYPELGMRVDYDSSKPACLGANCSAASAIPRRCSAWPTFPRPQPAA